MCSFVAFTSKNQNTCQGCFNGVNLIQSFQRHTFHFVWAESQSCQCEDPGLFSSTSSDAPAHHGDGLAGAPIGAAASILYLPERAHYWWAQRRMDMHNAKPGWMYGVQCSETSDNSCYCSELGTSDQTGPYIHPFWPSKVAFKSTNVILCGVFCKI